MVTIFIIDRFEGNWAVIEFEDVTFNIPRSLIPKSAKEGDVIKISVSVDKNATFTRKSKIKKLVDELFED